MLSIYTTVKTVRLSVTEVGALSAAGWAWSTRYGVSQPVASRRLNADWLSCCGRCDVDGGGVTGCTALVLTKCSKIV